LFSYEKTTVQFRKLKPEEIRYYVRNFKPFDKAGAYGIQDDFGCLFIKKIIGDYYNVVGLPLTNLFLSLQKLLSK
jgi:septum formation protein